MSFKKFLFQYAALKSVLKADKFNKDQSIFGNLFADFFFKPPSLAWCANSDIFTSPSMETLDRMHPSIFLSGDGDVESFKKPHATQHYATQHAQ